MIASNCNVRFDVQSGTTLRQLIIVAATSMFISGSFSTRAIAETKVKPDLPLDEEIYEPPKAKPQKKTIKKDQSKQESKAPQAEPSSQEETDSHHSDDKGSHEAGSSSGEHSSTSAESSKQSSDHSTTGDDHEASEEVYYEAGSTQEAHDSRHSEPKLLEGKVQPTPATKGSGMVWFIVVFALLAAAIFIFT